MVADEVALEWPTRGQAIDSGKPLRIEVRPTEESTTPVTLTGKLVFRGHPDRKTGFAGYRVIATYTVRDELAGAFTPGSASVDMADGNTFPLDLPDQEKLGNADVRVSAKYPDGQDAATTDVPVAELDEAVTLTVDPAHPVVLTGGGAVPARRLRGKVVDEAGKVDVRNRQVILWGKPSDADLRPIVVEKTDTMGNFSTTWPTSSSTRQLPPSRGPTM